MSRVFRGAVTKVRVLELIAEANSEAEFTEHLNELADQFEGEEVDRSLEVVELNGPAKTT